jgi:predicted HTH transcriptional regulator
MFSFIGYVERAGSGADTILQGWKENNWPKPQIRELYDPDEVELTLYFKSPDTGNELKVDTNGDTNDDTNKLTDRQRLY